MSSETQITVETVSFKRDGHVVMAHYQTNTDPEADESRWMFHVPQIIELNQVPISVDTNEYYADSIEKRDILAESLLDAIGEAKIIMIEMQEKAREMFIKKVTQDDTTIEESAALSG